MSLSNTILEPSQFEILEDEVREEEAMIKLACFFEKVWARFDIEEPSIDDYYNF